MSLFDVVIDASFSALATMWLGSVAFVWRDARARFLNRHAAPAAALAAALLPFLGAFLWFAARPVETISERRERRLLTRLLEQQLERSRVAAPSSAARAEANRVRETTTHRVVRRLSVASNRRRRGRNYIATDIAV